MRAIIIAMLTVAGIGLLGPSGTQAAPAGGAALRDAAAEGSLIGEVQIRRCRPYLRYRGRLCQWAACGVPLPGTNRSRCGYRCPGIPGLVWSGWC